MTDGAEMTKIPAKRARNFHYVRLADDLEKRIMMREFKAGEKLPSIRKLHHQSGLSISTVYQAFVELEKRGLVEARQKSGFYVRPLLKDILSPPTLMLHRSVPERVTISGLAGSILEAMSDPDILNLGGAVPAPELLPLKQLARVMKGIPGRELGPFFLSYDCAAGARELREEISKRTFGLFREIGPEEIITTNGCLEAVNLCLRAVGKPGDTILVESPTFHGFLQMIEDLNMYALEVQSDPEKGMDMKAFMRSVEENPVKACLMTPTFQNPLGSLMPKHNRKTLVEYLIGKEIPIIEDDIYGDLYFGKTRPSPLKAFDRKGLVLYCSSFSKALAPGMRVGWTIPGRFREEVKRIKMNTTLATSRLNQMVIAQFLKCGAYDRHLRRLRNALKNQVSNMRLAIAGSFPKGTKITSPHGGIVLWVQLDEGIDSLAIYHEAVKKNISILPGVVCSASRKYNNCIRISCGHPWGRKVEQGVAQLGSLIKEKS